MKPASYIFAASLVLSFGLAEAAPRNWIDRYIATHGNCQQQPNGAYITLNPFEKPIEEWTDEDLVMLKAALAHCDALPEEDTGVSRLWTGQFYERYAALVHAAQERASLRDDAKVAAQERAEQVEVTRKKKMAADKQAAIARMEALARATEQEAIDKKASQERAAATVEEQKAASRLADETEARAKAVQAEAQARHGVNEARQRAERAEALAENAEQQAASDRANADRRFAETHPNAYVARPAPQNDAPAFNLRARTVGCTRKDVFDGTTQAIARQDMKEAQRLVQLGVENGFCALLQPGAYVIAERAPDTVCIAHEGATEACSWVFDTLAK